jgi:serine protease inhibitor
MRFKNLFLSTLGFLLTACQLNAQEENTKPPLSTLSEAEVVHFEMLVQGNNRFAFDLYQHLRNQPGNLYFSPYSIVTGLGMVSLGARGETANQFQRAFRYSTPLLLFIGDLDASLKGDKAGQVLLANGLWIDQSVKIFPSFTVTLKRNFRFELQPVDFASNLNPSIQKINQWTSKQTAGKIGSEVAPQDVTVNSRMILTTAAYIKGQWAYPFNREQSKRLPFQISARRTFLADMMQHTAQYMLLKGEKWDILVIPFEHKGEGAQLMMVILLPKKDVPIADLEKEFTWENWRQWEKQLSSQLVTLTLPSFRIDKRLDLNTTLKALGFSKLFNSEANFSAMTEEKGIFLNTAIHKTSIRVDEKGTDANAVVSAKPATLAAEGTAPYEFTADHPFIFMIWDQKTDSILFMGRLALP